MSELRAREVFFNARLMVIVIEALYRQSFQGNSGSRLYADIKPVAVIVCAPDQVYAIDMDDKPVNVENLKRDIPDLKDMIEERFKGTD